MKYVITLLVLLTGSISFLIPPSSALCLENQDWDKAPCLDNMADGRYNQEDVNRWVEYYWYKGSEIMEAKYLELEAATNENRLNQWIQESAENKNVYQYYFFSGRAPDVGVYRGSFDIILVNEPDDVKIKRSFANLPPATSDDNLVFVVTGILCVSIVSFIIWKKRK